MRSISVSGIVCLCLLPPFAGAQTSNEEILEEVRALRAEVKALRSEIEELKEFEPENSFHSIGDHVERGADLEALAQIKLPTDPTPDQVSQYIKRVLDASEGQNRYSSTDPQSDMLARVGPEHVVLLLDTLRYYDSFVNSMYVIAALQQIVTAEHKDPILSRLAVDHALVEVVLRKGWSSDARDILIEELEAGAFRLPVEWIFAVAELNDPTTYELLKKAMRTSYNPHLVYDQIAPLEGIELGESVNAKWKSLRDGNTYVTDMFAGIAAQYGNLDAVEHLIELLDEPDYYGWGERGSVRRQLIRVIEFRGTNDEISAWFQENRDMLAYDPEKRMFVTSE